MVKCESLRINMFPITHTEKSVNFPVTAIRTNNDVEGWHNGLNWRAQGKVHLPFYLLIELLKKEADLVNLQMRLVTDQKLKRIQRKQYREPQSKLMGQWEDYASNRKSVFQLFERMCTSVWRRPLEYN